MAFIQLNDQQQQRLASFPDRQLFDRRITEALKHPMRETTIDTPAEQLQRIMRETIDRVLDELDPSVDKG